MLDKIFFTMSLGFLNTGIITLTLTLVNYGLDDAFVKHWFTSWCIAYLIVVPVSLIASPKILQTLDKLRMPPPRKP